MHDSIVRRSVVDIVRSRLTHIGPIATRMREMDRLETEAMGSTPKRSLRNGLRLSLNPMTVMVDGKPEAMFGVVPRSLMDGKGTVWMLGTEEIYRHPRDLALIGPRVIAAMVAECPILENVVSVENKRAISYLRHLGFSVGGPTYMHGGVEFVGFRYAIQDKERAT